MTERTEQGVVQTSRSRQELRTLLSDDPLLSSVGSEALDDMVGACELLEVTGGTRLLRAGQPLDSLIGVLHGALRVVRRTDDGLERTLREFHRGETLGLIGLLSDRPFPVDLFAIRDSTIMRLSRDRFLALAEEHTGLLLWLARFMSERAFDVLDVLAGTRRPSAAHGGTLALLTLSLDPSLREIKDALIQGALRQHGVVHVTAQLVDHALGAGAADGAENERITAWLSELEGAAHLVLYDCDPRLPRWNERCLRQADRVVIVWRAGEPPIDRMERAATHGRTDGLPRPIDLVLVHHPMTKTPSNTRAWSDVPRVRAIHHVRVGRGADIDRVIRRIAGRPTGLVLSGGGARGIAHVGVIAAIVEAGIPIDYVCGTSMGAIFGAGFALGYDIQGMREEVRKLFGRPFSLYDLTVPISSLLAGKKLERVLRRLLGDGDIEDLWLPFFCVSTDLARAKLIVHDRGCLWRSVRASCSIPGIFPPVPMEGRTLVDGGLVDNLPLDLLLERCAGPIIAVDVFPYGDPNFEQPSAALARRLRRLRTQLRGERASPPLFDILMRSTLIGSKVRQTSALMGAEQILYLEPPVASFGALQWRSHRALFEAGRLYAQQELARHRSRFPARSSR